MVLIGLALFAGLTYLTYFYLDVMFKVLLSIFIAACTMQIIHNMYVGIKNIYGFNYKDKVTETWAKIFKRKRKSNVAPT